MSYPSTTVKDIQRCYELKNEVENKVSEKDQYILSRNEAIKNLGHLIFSGTATDAIKRIGEDQKEIKRKYQEILLSKETFKTYLEKNSGDLLTIGGFGLPLFFMFFPFFLIKASAVRECQGKMNDEFNSQMNIMSIVFEALGVLLVAGASWAGSNQPKIDHDLEIKDLITLRSLSAEHKQLMCHLRLLTDSKSITVFKLELNALKHKLTEYENSNYEFLGLDKWKALIENIETYLTQNPDWTPSVSPSLI